MQFADHKGAPEPLERQPTGVENMIQVIFNHMGEEKATVQSWEES